MRVLKGEKAAKPSRGANARRWLISAIGPGPEKKITAKR